MDYQNVQPGSTTAMPVTRMAASNQEASDLQTRADALDQLTTAVAVVDSRLAVRYLNPAAEAFFGTSRQHCVGSPIADLLYQGGSPALDGLENIFSSGQSVTKRGAEFRIRDGRETKADLTASLERDANHLVIEIQPINRLLRINRDDHSAHSQETNRHLIRGMAHEIKNPLGGLRGAAQLLERELSDKALREYTQIIIEEADRLTALVDRLLGPNRQLATDNVNLHETLEHVVRLVDAELPGKIDFLRDYDPSLPDVVADRAQLVQALMNIIRNAGQALRNTNGAQITLRTRAIRQFTIGTTRHRLAAQIDVVDNGPGIPEDMTERIWFPMISGRADGTGLGLAITQTIVGQHGGIIECKSEPGNTCFSVYLPYADNNQENENNHD
jgi:two-component system nitrogen regulation sensor histidine kinase GlnL